MSVNNIQGDATPAPNVTSGSRPDSNTATPTSQYDANTLDQLTEEERTEINEAFDKLEAAGDKELYVYLSGGTDNAFCGSHWNHSHQTKGTMLMLFIEDDGTRKTELAGCCPEVSVPFLGEDISAARQHS
jgi:hypothetical protein